MNLETDNLAARLQRIEDQLALRELVARYALAVAKADAETLIGLFAPQGRFVSTHSDGLGGEALQNFFRHHLQPAGTIPMVTNHVIRIDGDLAEGDCTMSTPWRDQEEGFCGTYRDRYQRSAEGWRFLERRWTYHLRQATT